MPRPFYLPLVKPGVLLSLKAEENPPQNFSILRRAHQKIYCRILLGPSALRRSFVRCLHFRTILAGGCWFGRLRKYIDQIAVWVKIVLLGGFNQTENDCTALCPIRGVGRQEVLLVRYKGLMLRLIRLLFISGSSTSR